MKLDEANDVPDDWTQRPIGDIAGKLQYGWTTRGRPGKGVKLLRTTDISSGAVDWDSVPSCEETPTNLDKYALRPGDIVVSRAGSVGLSSLIDESCPSGTVFASYLIRIQPDPTLVSPKFLRHYMQSPYYWRQVQDASVGSGLANVNASKLSAMTVPIPSLDEQNRLVSLLDKFDSRRISVAGHLTNSTRVIELFRQAVLAAACSGRLTADWRPESNDSDRELPTSWETATIDSLASSEPRSIQSGPFGSNLLHSEFTSEGALAIGIDNVLDGTFSLGREHRISDQKFQTLRKYQARPLDVLVTVMATVGRTCVVPAGIDPAIITKHVYRITVNKSRVNPFYLMNVLKGCPGVLEQIHQQVQGQTRPGINGKILKSLEVPVPPIREQAEIVRRINDLFSLAQSALSRVETASRQVERSTKAVLSKAFRGELGIDK